MSWLSLYWTRRYVVALGLALALGSGWPAAPSAHAAPGSLVPDLPPLTPAQQEHLRDLAARSQAGLPLPAPAPASRDLPVIDVWYGLEQSFGVLGTPQNWINILGNVADPDTVIALTYSLNGGPEQNLSIGPDYRRLADPGDFNADLAFTDLIDGVNTVTLRAIDTLANETVQDVTVNYDANSIWPLPYAVDWDTVLNVHDATQVVDGQWAVAGGGLRTLQVDYDRVIAFGDLSWTDYEITAPVTFHGIEPTGPYSGDSGGWGFTARWTGHTDNPVPGWQPKSGWLPSGASCYYRAGSEQMLLDGISMPLTIDIGDTYVFKYRVRSTPGQGGLYQLKVWRQGEPEPSGWQLVKQRSASDETNGCMILYAHHTDVTLGDFQITTIPVTISQVEATVLGGDTAHVSWITDVPADSRVDYGLDGTYGLSVFAGDLVTEHSLTLTELLPDTTYHYQVTSVDALGNPDVTRDLTFTTETWDVVSDDFSSCELDTTIWSWVDPLGDASLVLNGTQAVISLPAGTAHNVWGSGPADFANNVARLTQPAEDSDFTLEAKFESAITARTQAQGVMFIQDPLNLMFVQFGDASGGQTEIVALRITNGAGGNLGDWGVSITPMGTQPLSMRIQRTGNLWTVHYSLDDGASWLLYKSFTRTMTLTEVAVFAGNNGSIMPAHTAVIDYFFDAGEPIDPEDGNSGTPPAPVTDLVAAPILTGNDGDGTIRIGLTWSPVPGASELDVYRHPFGFYPEYDDEGGTAPQAPAVPNEAGWEFVATVPMSDAVLEDEPLVRDSWYYVAFGRDACDNLSPVSNLTAGSLNYIPGDVTDGVTPGQGDNLVSSEDLLLLEAGYGTADGEPGYDSLLDVGPTVGGLLTGRPLTDDLLEFEDLVIMALNYGAPSTKAPAIPVPKEMNALRLRIDTVGGVGSTLTASLLLTADGSLQAMSIPLLWNPDVLELEGTVEGDLLQQQGGEWRLLTPQPGTVDVALLGRPEPGLLGEGVLATLTFRILASADPVFAFGEIRARDRDNQVLVIDASVDELSAVPELPRETALHANVPNPFNPITQVSFDLAQASRVRLEIFDVGGARVRVLLDETRPAGRHQVIWDGRDDTGRTVASGVYVTRLVAGNVRQMTKMMLLK
jgi:hypothetical protein